MHVDLINFQHPRVVSERFIKLFFSRNLFGQIKLTADLTACIIKSHRMTATGCHGGISQTRRASTHNGDFFRRASEYVVEKRLVTGSGIHQTADLLAFEAMIKTGLVAGNTGINLIFTALKSL